MRLVVDVWVPGHPVTKGSVNVGRQGQIRQAAKGYAVWADTVRKAVAADAESGRHDPLHLAVEADEYAYVHCGFWVPTGDGDKLTRTVWDAITKAKVWPDDVCAVVWSGYRYYGEGQSDGVHIRVHAIGQREYDRFRREARHSIRPAYDRALFGNVVTP